MSNLIKNYKKNLTLMIQIKKIKIYSFRKQKKAIRY